MELKSIILDARRTTFSAQQKTETIPVVFLKTKFDIWCHIVTYCSMTAKL